MGTFSITVPLSTYENITVNSTSEIDCNSTFNVTINVPTGQSRHVAITGSEDFFTTPINETITVSKTYDIIIEGSNIGTKGLKSAAHIVLKKAEADLARIDFKSFSRYHNGTYC
ncbi:hypothetical protein N356_gp076 [Cellulophaga phage phi14:2]|uniref:Uncharacterized protein n=1 Tax=Cellulophaga phage phi14:2 TaxID=1327990 RepID=S0A411_9CAUD|nr:hypothetical protein N356_gp076 [Cellulophaga phage phi14:2]AGO48968.1 hypothetical protein Phi14:2_gp090 [Cellulophaga phage phi14:2]